MGQNPSRQRRTALTSSSTTDPSPAPPEQDSEQAVVSPPRRSRRESVRRSILNLVKPSVRVDRPAGSSRKSWRNSRRWSKAPPQLESHAESSQSAGSSNAPSSPINEKGNGVDHDPDALSIVEQQAQDSDRPSSSSYPISEETTTDVAGTAVVDAEGVDDQSDAAGATQTSAPPQPDDQDGIVITPDLPLDSTPPALQLENVQDGPADGSAPGAQQTPAHQFPPPGTLVVVQGVVHTTDVPRPSAPSAAQPEVAEPAPRSSSTPPTTRNRLSTLLQSRPGSIVGSRPASAIGTLPPSNNQTSTTLDATPTSDGLQADPLQLQTDLPDPSARSPAPPAQTLPSNDSPSGTISSGSIDVLGTLLSVAAAATAASLLTGTSQPLLLPSSLGPPAYNAELGTTTANTPVGSPGPSEPTTSRPTSPTPTAGLGLDASRAERLRQAWGSIRERLGLRPTPPPSTTPTSASASASEMDLPATSPSGDPREHLFGQMARAFNLGLGLASESATAPAPTSMRATPPRSREDEQVGAGDRAAGQLPAEGSFERFLIDLQTDLRAALTSTNDTLSSTTTSDGAEAEPAEASAPRTFAAPSTDDGDEDEVEDEDQMPPLGDISDSDSEFLDAEDEESVAGDEGSPGIPASSSDAGPSRVPPAPPRGESIEDSSIPTTNLPGGAASAEPSTAQGSIPEVDAQGRINWWRLYRFPPIAIPPTQGTPAAAATPSPSGPTALTATPSPPSSSLAMDPTLSELPFANSDPPLPQASPQPRAYTVVPVIVVGVQSVNANWQLQPPTDEDQDVADDAVDAPTDGEGTGAAQARTRGRGRGWHSRAAEAIRNLRPGRRARNAAPANTPGSRTFLIYVIGGYYPPNHSILNGGPDTLASLEALLELADLLGHAKPPTVTKEDIEKSGLEIIKSAQLEQYEKEEKISSNCTERCLICLDDYQPEDDIRVMKCRHAFHQNCVDKWLETGRNNCPACRSKGVSVDDT